jgi:4-hydroxybenzoate polyprenyltransferase
MAMGTQELWKAFARLVRPHRWVLVVLWYGTHIVTPG